MNTVRMLSLVALMMLAPLVTDAEPLPEGEVPPPLRSWIPWVLHDGDDRACPYSYNENKTKRCVWPGQLSLELGSHGGQFSLRVETFRSLWVPLPGDALFWPQELKADGKEAAVVANGGLPGVTLSAGPHALSGRFVWDRVPENLRVPPSIGLVELKLNGRTAEAPRIDEQGRLWLQTDADSAPAGGRLEVHVERLLVDEIPFQVTTRFSLTASGKNQEVVLPGAVLPEFVPLSLASPLPARIEANGKLRVQVRAGRWELYVVARRMMPLATLALPKLEEGGAQEEIWAFAPQTRLRVVNVDGGTPVDAQQTQLPQQWKSYPAYRIRPGEALRVKELKRGDPEPAPDALRLARTAWLDFDGRGYTIQDQITGTLSRSWRLEMASPIVLGRVAIDGQDQFITHGATHAGVEVRHGHARIVADSRIESPTRQLSAVGWTNDFQAASMTLNLPPGWRLFAATGADDVRGSWLSNWNNLLDFFIVLVIALGCGKLWGWRWGLLAAVALALSYYEPGAPRMAWVAALVAVALARVVTTGKLGITMVLLRRATLLLVLIVLIPFAVQQVRQTLYPVLEESFDFAEPQGGLTVGANQAAQAPRAASVEERAPADAASEPTTREMLSRRKAESRGSSYLSKSAELDRIDPKAMVQTGPGLPQWQWRNHQLSWSGPVQATQQVDLWLIPPTMNGLLTALRLVLLGLLFLRVADVALRLPRVPGRGAAVVSALILACIVATPDTARAQATPDPALLQQLKEKLLLPPQCLPSCAELARMHVSIAGDVLRIRLEAHAAQSVAIPLPAAARQWLPREVLIDGKPAAALARDEHGTLWARVPQGVHQILLLGGVHGLDSVQLALPLKPRRIEADTADWTLDGVRENGVADSNLQLTRRQRNHAAELDDGNLPPFVRVERTLVLGLQWQVHTRISRMSPANVPAVLEVPLLPGEAITSAEPRVENGHALVNMGPQTNEIAWDGALKEVPNVKLVAAKQSSFVEEWRVNAGTQWHVAAEGIAPVQHQESDRWLPQWQPWPGEGVTLKIAKPEGIPGQTATLDRSHLVLQPGVRVTDATLVLTLRSSRGGQHTLTLPPEAVLQRVAINGQLQPIRLEGRELRLPLTPGTQNIEVRWQQPGGIAWRYAAPEVDVGLPSVNARTEIHLPGDRWLLLFGGPTVGPAILFWGVAIVIALLAFPLGRLGLSPLKGWQWLLLGLGLTQDSIVVAAILIGWFFALALRARYADQLSGYKWRFNLTQIGLVLITLAAAASLYSAVSHGLLGTPDMQVAGNGSSHNHLIWYQDRASKVLPIPWLVSVPILVYRLLMLAWALWLAYSLLGWVRWAWHCFSAGGLWRKLQLWTPRPRKSAPAAAAEGS